ncbi:hypothetical protein CHS0354_042694 [Potamilus streckersoni]|uniref:Uncharacterized protein n=1 Tax=Potamilus streckersoni TaxID=2493646 RepID=A0AAE0SAD0_9BIVA|nr:hypothetical protein CHS0354_042694 [Potamilus streckersoni]
MFPQNSRIYLTFISFYFLFAIFIVNSIGGDVNSEKFKKLEGHRIIDIIKTINCSTKLQCCSRCIEVVGCVSVNFRKNSPNLNCDLNWKTPLDANVSIEKFDSSFVFFIDNDPWKLVFRVTAGGTTDPYYAWLNGIGTDNSDDCMMLYPPSCTTYYRHNLLDDWQNWSIKQVKLALYEYHTLVAYIIFNGEGSDMQSWFSKGRLKQTSWTDLASSTLEFFSLKGDDYWGRHFFIHGSYTLCAKDYGWILVNSGIRPYCPFDQHGSYPSIIYARNGVKSIYGSQGYGEADVLAIYIKQT